MAVTESLRNAVEVMARRSGNGPHNKYVGSLRYQSENSVSSDGLDGLIKLRSVYSYFSIRNPSGFFLRPYL